MSDAETSAIETDVAAIEPVVPAADIAPAAEPEVETDPVRRAYNEVAARPRDEKGKFIALETAEAKPEPPKTAIEQAQIPTPPAAPTEAAAPAWHAEVSKLEETVRPRLAASGVAFPAYVQNLIAADEYLMREPQKALDWLRQIYERQPQPGPGAAAAGPQDHRESQEDGQAAPQPEWIAAYHQLNQQHQQLQNQVLQQHLDGQIKAFAAQADKYPHFEAARSRMAELYNKGFAGTLEDAYNVAIYTDETLRTKIEADREKQRIDETAKKAAAARRASAVNVEPSVATTPTRKGSLNDTVAAVVHAAYGTTH